MAVTGNDEHLSSAKVSLLGDRGSEPFQAVLSHLVTSRYRVGVDEVHPAGAILLVTSDPLAWQPTLGNGLARTILIDCNDSRAHDSEFAAVLDCPDNWRELDECIRGVLEAAEKTEREFEALAAPNLIGRAPAFLDACDLIKLFAPSNLPILIEGETGTGKELAARALHYLSPRCSAPLVPVNCGALPELLIENELFGHLAGAFTDARQSSEGLIAQAEGGSLFLDEVEALPQSTQVALLRFLQAYEYRPLGGGELRRADLRIIAASNEPLLEAVEKGRFRRDLYYRLAVGHLVMPPLRDRPGDAILLARAYMERINVRNSGDAATLEDDTLAWIESQSWPGNVRELINFVERTVILGGAVPRAAARACPATATPPLQGGFQEAKAEAVAEFEREYLVSAMRRAHGNISEAARRAKKDRRAFGRLLSKHGIDRRDFA